MIYLDHASYTATDPAVLAEFCRVEEEYSANALSTHMPGRAVKAEFDRVRAGIASLLGALPEEIIFTSGATEANALAIRAHARTSRHLGKHIITTGLEHPSVSGPLADLKDQGYEIEMAEILPDGTMDLEYLGALLRPDTVLLTAPWVDSELGAIQPIEEISKLLAKYPGCRFHVDAAQAVGKVQPVRSSDRLKPDSLKPDSLSISPHKFHGICGVGILVMTDAMTVHDGTPALALAASAYRALELALSGLEERSAKVTALRERIIRELGTKVKINSPINGSPYILNLSVPGIKGSDFQAALDKRGVCVSVKSACAAQGTPSRAVLAVSRDRKNALASWRLSFSHLTEMSEAEGFIAAFDECYEEFK